MLNTGDPKVKEALQGIHEAMLQTANKARHNKEEYLIQNRLLSVLCTDFDLDPLKAAEIMNRQYGYYLTCDDVIRLFRSVRLSNPRKRKELLQWADNVSGLFAGALQGKRELFDKFEKARKEPALKNGDKHDSQERVAAIMIYKKYPEIDSFGDTKLLYRFGNIFARYFVWDMADAICEAYGYPQYRERMQQQAEKKLSYEQALKKAERLEKSLERTNTMLQDLQDEFAEQLEASKVKELTDFFARLNSEKYGCILDELLIVRKGVDELRKSNYELPIEISGLLIMVKKLIQFVRDSHIEPMMKIGSVREVVASDVEFFNYEGSPFATPEEKKTVQVISPGWIYKDKELQISRPKVKEAT